MKKIIVMSMLSFAVCSAYAQTVNMPATYNNAGCKVDRNMPANARPVWPKSAYTPTQDPSCPPCYEYRSKHGVMIMECPFLVFPPEHRNGEQQMSLQSNENGSIKMQSQNAYTGNYPAVCERDPGMPANARPAWPKSDYTPTGNPACAPCYEYTTKRGLKVMECNHLWFPPEHKE